MSAAGALNLVHSWYPVCRNSLDDVVGVVSVAQLLRLGPDHEGTVEEVVQPARSPGGQRRYSRDEVTRVQHVTAMADEGMTLAGIRRILVLEAEVADLKEQLA